MAINPARNALPDGELRVFHPDPAEGDLARMYSLDVLGVCLVVYVNPAGETRISIDTTDSTSGDHTGQVVVSVNGTESHLAE